VTDAGVAPLDGVSVIELLTGTPAPPAGGGVVV
jgi:hypothetical protein